MTQQILSSIITILTFFVLLFVYTKVAGPLPFSVSQVTTTKTTTFDVSGQGKAQVKSDNATVQAGVSAKADTQTQVQDKINSTINAVSQAVKDLGVDPKDIQTTNYSVNPNYEYSNGSQKQNGFAGSTNLTIKVKDITKVNQVIDAATNNGATNVSNLGFGSTDKTVALKEARNMAIADAKKKAQDAASAAEFKLGNLIGYQESENGGGRPILFNAVGGALADKQTNLEPGSNEVALTVTLSYEIK